MQVVSGNCLFTDVFFSFWLREGTRDTLSLLFFGFDTYMYSGFGKVRRVTRIQEIFSTIVFFIGF